MNFISSKDIDEEHLLYSKSNNIEILSQDKGDESIEELFESLISRYQVGLRKSTKGSDFIFDYVSLLCYKCRKINRTCGEWYIVSLNWMKNKKINNKCHQ